jgi:hypothetical protein
VEEALRFGEYEGRATRRRDTCIIGIAVLNANAVDVLALVPQRQRRAPNRSFGASAPPRTDTELRATPMTGQFLVNCEHLALSARRLQSRG